MSWLSVRRGTAPLIVSLPHTGTNIPDEHAGGLVSDWLALRDTDWHIEKLYGFAEDMGATVIRTAISRTVIDVNRPPDGASLYPGAATTGLCPTTSFDGEPLYRPGAEPDDSEIETRRRLYFEPYHAALDEEITRLRGLHPTIVVYDAHSIRSVIPRLFEGRLPVFNIGSNDGRACAPGLVETIAGLCAASDETIVNGRFKGGWITRRLGDPEAGVHAVQMELACRAYLDEPLGEVDESNWPVAYDEDFAAPLRVTLQAVLGAGLAFAGNPKDR